MSFDAGAVGAAVTTTNTFCAAPVYVLRRHLEQTAHVQHWLLNAGNANAGTGDVGMQHTLQTVDTLAQLTDSPANGIWPFSTGVIGEPLPVRSICDALPRVLQAQHETAQAWDRAARAIMTTDTHPKCRSLTCTLGGTRVTLTGMAKGSGMIHPNMATMFGLIATDAQISADCLQLALQHAVGHSFNCVTVDGDTSTNDACALVATHQAQHTPIEDPHAQHFICFQDALSCLCDDLAEMLVRDGEGASKFVRVSVTGALNTEDAHQVANTVALSPLVKTALAASDPNWGRIVAAIGRAGIADLRIERVHVWVNDVQIVRDGGRDPAYTEARGQKAMAPTDIEIHIALNLGEAQCRVMTCDLTTEYIRINAEYRT
jgi:glutamate N-acetyltransferase/amino-acid N-acetyltransferase